MAFLEYFSASENEAALVAVIQVKSFQLLYVFKFENVLRCCPVFVDS